MHSSNVNYIVGLHNHKVYFSYKVNAKYSVNDRVQVHSEGSFHREGHMPLVNGLPQVLFIRYKSFLHGLVNILERAKPIFIYALITASSSLHLERKYYNRAVSCVSFKYKICNNDQGTL